MKTLIIPGHRPGAGVTWQTVNEHFYVADFCRKLVDLARKQNKQVSLFDKFAGLNNERLEKNTKLYAINGTRGFEKPDLAIEIHLDSPDATLDKSFCMAYAAKDDLVGRRFAEQCVDAVSQGFGFSKIPSKFATNGVILTPDEVYRNGPEGKPFEPFILSNAKMTPTFILELGPINSPKLKDGELCRSTMQRMVQLL